MADIHRHIFEWFNNVIPSAFHVEFYSVEAEKVLHLNEDVLKSKNNPFLFDPVNSDQNNERVVDWIELLIVNDSPPNDQINLQLNTLSNTSFDGLDNVLLNIIPSGELGDALLFSSFVPSPLNEDLFHNNISTHDTDDDTMEDNSVGNLTYPSINPQVSITSSNEYQLPTESNDEIDTQSERVVFSHDVHPRQKHHYLTNKYKIGDESDKNCGISYVQGVKTEEEIKKRAQVLPHLLISRLYRTMEKINLLIYAVFEEEEENGMRIWYKNPHKGFLLHAQLNSDAEFFNPIKLELNNTQWKENGDYTLEIYMLTKLNKKSKNKEAIYRLGKQATIEIHKAKHIVSSKRKHLKPTRLLCVHEIDNEIDWTTVGLSNFIQPPEEIIQPSAVNAITTVQIKLPEPKRQKV